MIFLIATKNKKKKIEMERILGPLGIEFKTADELGLDLPEVEETELTFEGNAYLKAKAACDFSGLPCIADDSGLCIDALDGAPGVFSARYSGVHGDEAECNKKVLKELENVPYEKRSAHYECAVCLVYPDGKTIKTSGRCDGIIGFKEIGNEGFGYDPLFMINDRSFGQFSPDEKDEISHRSKALHKLKEELINDK